MTTWTRSPSDSTRLKPNRCPTPPLSIFTLPIKWLQPNDSGGVRVGDTGSEPVTPTGSMLSVDSRVGSAAASPLCFPASRRSLRWFVAGGFGCWPQDGPNAYRLQITLLSGVMIAVSTAVCWATASGSLRVEFRHISRRSRS
jgi:hypothetical protein